MPEIKMPKLSDTMTEGTLVVWKKKKGENVAAGDVLAEIETDKATMEWESSDDGVLAEIYVNEGERVTVGSSIAFVQAKGEEVPAGPSGSGSAKASKAAPAAPAPKAAPAPAAPAAPAAVPAPVAVAAPVAAPHSESANGRVKASPLAKKIAAAKGVDLSRVTGTGPGGRITERDVETALKAPAPAAAAPKAAPAAPLVTGDADIRIPLSGMRRVIAERLVQSKSTIPHFYLSVEVDAGELMRLRSEVNAAAVKSGGDKFTVNDFILKATIAAAVKVPKVNAAFETDAIVQFGSIHLSVAVSVDDGLVTPVIRDAQTRTLRELSVALSRSTCR